MGSVTGTINNQTRLAPSQISPAEVKSEFDYRPSSSSSWKSTLMFTGNDLAFPVEMFIALMDQNTSNALGVRDVAENKKMIVENVLSHIPNLDIAETNDAYKDFPASVWKQQHLNRLRQLSWEELKQELVSEFGLKREYGLNDKLELLLSIGKGESETRDNFLLRIHMIVCCIEHGNMRNAKKQVNETMNTMAASSEIWVELLCIAGLSNASHNFPFLSSRISSKASQEIPSHSSGAVSSGIKDVVYNEANQVAPFSIKKYIDASSQCTSLNSKDIKYENESDEKLRTSPIEKRIFQHLQRTEGDVEDFGDPIFSIQEDVEANGEEDQIHIKDKGQQQQQEEGMGAILNKYSCKILSKVAEEKDSTRLNRETSNNSPLKYVVPEENSNLKGKRHHVVVVCGVCNREMKNSKELAKHRSIEHNGMKFRCEVCEYLCKRPAELARHRLSRHLLETEGFKSLICSYENCDFKCLEVSKDMLQKHIGKYVWHA